MLFSLIKCDLIEVEGIGENDNFYCFISDGLIF